MKSIGFIFFLAWRNVIRYRKRTLQSFMILFLGTFCVMLVDAFMKGYSASSTTRIVSQAGHLDVHAAGYLDSAEAMPLDLAILDAEGVQKAMLDAAALSVSPGTHAVLAPLIATGCMLSNGDVSRAASVLATNPLAETRDGAFPVNPVLRSTQADIIAGRYYRDNREAGAILDEKYAKKLALGVGDSLVLLGNDAFGSFSMMETPILAIAREASLPEEAGCIVDLASFAPVFGLEGQATAIGLWFAKADGSIIPKGHAEGEAVRAIIASVGSKDGLEVRSFSDISSSYATMFEFLDFFLAGMMAVFATVAAVGITNAILLSVQDRVKDLGTLRAIALTSRQASGLVYAETLITGVTAALFSLGVALLVIAILIKTGVGIRFELSDMGSALPEAFKPELFPARLLVIAAASAVFPLLAAVIPAYTARKLTIRESLGI